MTFDIITTEVSFVKTRSFLINSTNARNELSLEKVKVFNGQLGTRPSLLLETVYQYNEPCHSGLISKYAEATPNESAASNLNYMFVCVCVCV